MREQLRLVFGNFRKSALKTFSNTGVKGTSRLAQEGAVSRDLYQRVLELISGVWRYALPEQQPSRYKAVQRRLDVRFGFPRYHS